MRAPSEFFEEIASIPRPSGEERAICDYVEDFARRRSLAFRRDELDNIVVWKNASPGMEGAPAVMLQAHTDMVPQKIQGSPHDFSRDPIRILKQGDIWRADGTTLGGDNGAGVAMMLALLEGTDAAHPALECVFTAQEEVGLIGASALDTSDLKAKVMLNLDCGPEGTFLVSCAGGRRVRVKRDLHWEQAQGGVYQLEISGLAGGHSGTDIHLGRGNALVLLARVIDELTRSAGARLCALEGGDKDNVICPHASVVLACEHDPAPAVARLAEDFRRELAASDPGVELILSPVKAERMLAPEDHAAALGLLLLLPHGVREFNHIAAAPEVSANFGSARIGEEGLCVNLSLRSSSESRKEALYREAQAACAAFGASCAFDGDYPGWAYEPDSPARRSITALYTRQTGKEPVVQGIHAGLECGVFKGKMPWLDIVAMGPNHGDLHSADEWLDVASLQRTYELIRMLLKEM